MVLLQDPSVMFASTSLHSTMERTTQTEPPKTKKWKQVWLCFLGDDKFRRQRQREATEMSLYQFIVIFQSNFFFQLFICYYHCILDGYNKRYINSVSLIDRSARIGFPLSFGILILLYWLIYVTYQDDFPWFKEQRERHM